MRFDQLLLALGEEGRLAVRLAPLFAPVVVGEGVEGAHAPLHLAVFWAGARQLLHIRLADDLRGQEVRQLAAPVLAHSDVFNISFLLFLVLAA